MFETLHDGLKQAFKTLSGKARLTEANMREGLDVIRDALIEADVSYSVVKDFLEKVSEKALGEKVLTALRPTEQLYKIVFDELVNLMGPVDTSLHLRGELTTLMLCGLQGSGKTTSCGKFALMLKDAGRKPAMAAADLQRPAAIEQLRVLGEQIGVPVYVEEGAKDPVGVCQRSVKFAQEQGADVLILDTAGRLHVDDELMKELAQIDNRVQPDQVYLVVDSNTGQDAVNSAKSFNEALELDGVILTKLDGDARGGAALSVKHVTGVPIKFIGTGEKLLDLEPFSPDGLAGRILGQGDIVSLVQKAQRVIDEDEQQRLQQQMLEGQFTLEDFKRMMGMTARLGSMRKLMELVPGMGEMAKMMDGMDPDKDLKRVGGIIDSMTLEERRHPNPSKFIDQSRRRRIATGSGVEPHEVNKLVSEFDNMAQMMKSMGGKGGMLSGMKMLQELPKMMNSQGQLAKTKQSTGKRKSNAERKRDRKQRAKEIRKLRRERKS